MLKQIGLATLLVAATFTLTAFAAGKGQGGGTTIGNNGGGKGGCGVGQTTNGCGGGGGGGNKGVPGPIAGAGLPFLLIAGGYVLVRRYRNRSTAEISSPTIVS
ncbi:hypothetical protein AAII07_57950 [Microvirga sp. 0TCS3.31]